MGKVCVLLGDQLSESISSLKELDKKNDLILMCEVMSIMAHVRHHKKKLAFIISCMRHFALELKEKGYTVFYTRIDDKNNRGSIRKEVEWFLKRVKVKEIVITEPTEYHLLKEIEKWESLFKIPVNILEDDRYLCSKQEFRVWSRGKKQLRMEFFYREMRKKTSILMEGKDPIGGQWNYDAENRNPPKKGLISPSPFKAKKDLITEEAIKTVEKLFNDHFGDIEPFFFGVTRMDALEVLKDFINTKLPFFGKYQDAMMEGDPWMFHSHISMYLNCGLLLPMECIDAALDAFKKKEAPLNSVEGFIRQILGWREFVRGIYMTKMPSYAEENFFKSKRDLPDFYWTGQTEMNCIRQCVLDTKENAYAHHIQRLMVLGNFALLAGIDPVQVNEWFWIVYADAYEWVELPNVSGMALFADGGVLASKPYAAGGAYIHKMSNYCKNCKYSVTKKEGPEACPFNYLYWDFLARNRKELEPNPRIGMMYKTYDRMEEKKKKTIQTHAVEFLKEL